MDNNNGPWQGFSFQGALCYLPNVSTVVGVEHFFF